MKIKDIDGLPVIDATEAIVLKVTTRDIKGATTKAPDQCAIARACRRALHVKEARIHLSRMYLRVGEEWIRYQVPKAARDEIIAFDRGGQFEAGEFRFEKVRPSDKLGTNRGVKTKGGGTKRIKPHVVTNVRGSPV